MGVDVNLYAVGPVTDEQLDAANDFLVSRGVTGYDIDTGRDTAPPLQRDRWADDGRISCEISTRYYGPGYERGHWPQIHNAIVCLRVALPQCQVFYDGDYSDDGALVTDDLLAEIWTHWLGPNGQAYRAFMARGR